MSLLVLCVATGTRTAVMVASDRKGSSQSPVQCTDVPCAGQCPVQRNIDGGTAAIFIQIYVIIALCIVSAHTHTHTHIYIYVCVAYIYIYIYI